MNRTLLSKVAAISATTVLIAGAGASTASAAWPQFSTCGGLLDRIGQLAGNAEAHADGTFMDLTNRYEAYC